MGATDLFLVESVCGGPEGRMAAGRAPRVGRLDLFRNGWRDPDSGVRREALIAAAWARQPGLLEHCRKLAGKPIPDHADAIELLALLGGPEDLGCLLAAGQSRSGVASLSSFGSVWASWVVEVLLKAIEGSDPVLL